MDRTILLEDEVADGFLGATVDGRPVYSYEEMIESLANHSEMSLEEATEFIDYNTIRSLIYLNEKDYNLPVIIYEKAKNSDHSDTSNV